MDATLVLIDSEGELLRARALVDQLWNSNDPADVARLEAQARLIAAYEEMKWPRRPPSVADLIRHLMDQHGLARADLIPLLGTPSRVSEVMRGKNGSAWRWCSVCAPGSVCRPICSFRLRRSHRRGVRRSERRPDPVRWCVPRWKVSSHSMSCSNCRDCRSNAWTCLRSSNARYVNRPCLNAFRFSCGAPEPGAPPCIRQRFLPATAGDRQEPPERVLAPQRGLASIGPVLRE